MLVGQALRNECLAIFGSTWSYVDACRFARVAIDTHRRVVNSEIKTLRTALAEAINDSHLAKASLEEHRRLVAGAEDRITHHERRIAEFRDDIRKLGGEA